MKVHRSGAKQNIFLDSMSQSRGPCYGNYVSISSALISYDELFLKQYMEFTFNGDNKFASFEMYFNTICPHFVGLRNNYELEKIYQCLSGHKGGHCRLKCGDLKQCQFCPTEYLVGLCDQGRWSKKRMAYVTIWKNLGRCETPYDVKWFTQIGPGESRIYGGERLFSFAPGSIKGAFESKFLEEKTSARSKSLGPRLSALIPDALRSIGINSCIKDIGENSSVNVAGQDEVSVAISTDND